MNLLPHSLLLAACLMLPSLQAQTATGSKPAPAPAAATSPAGTTLTKTTTVTKTKPAPAKPSKEEMEKIHELAVMDVIFGGQTHQVIFELLPGAAPRTVENFRGNVEKGVYSGMAFHRTIDNYLVQTGDPASKDNANRAQWGLTQEHTIPGEFKLPHVTGAVAMARRGDRVNPERKSDGTQFYFVLGNMSALSGQYTVFGQVVSGMDVLKRISRAAHDSNDAPLERIEIKKIKIIDHKGPLVSLTSTGDGNNRRSTRPEGLKGPLEKMLERVW